MKHLYYFQNGSFYPYNQPNPYGGVPDPYQHGSQQAGLNYQYSPTFQENPLQMYSPGNYSANDINNDQIPDLVQPNELFQNPQQQQQKPQPNQQNNYNPFFGNPYAYNPLSPFVPPLIETRNFPAVMRGINTLATLDQTQYGGKNAMIQDPTKARNLAKGSAITSIAAGALGDTLGTARNFLSYFGNQKREAYLKRKDLENRRNGLLQNQQGQEMLFNQGYQQVGNINFIEAGGQVKNGGVSQNKYDNDGEKDIPIERLLTDSVTGVKQEKYNEGKGIQTVNSEVEKNEYIIFPTGEISKVEGNSHKDGGEKMELPEGAKIVSDNVLVSKEHAKIFKTLGISANTNNTYADILDKFRGKIGVVKLNEEQQGRFSELKKNDKNVKDDNTKKLNEEFISGKIESLENQKKALSPLENFFADVVYQKQEAAKKSPDVKKESDSDYDGENLYFNGGKIPIIFAGGNYHTTDNKNSEKFKSWAKEKGFKTMDEVNEYFKNGGKKKKEKIYENGGEQEIATQIQKMLQQLPPEQVIQQLVQSGMDYEMAAQMVENTMGQMQGAMMENGGVKKIKYYELGGEEIDAYIDKLIAFEGSKGSAEGKGLDISGFTGGKAKTKEELKKLINDQYLKEVKDELGDKYNKLDNQMLIELLDYKFNTGRNVGDLLSYASNEITLDEANSNKTFGAPEAINISVESLRKAKDDIYKTTKGGTLDKPSDAYKNSWSQRVNYLSSNNQKTEKEIAAMSEKEKEDYIKAAPYYKEDKDNSYRGFLIQPEIPYNEKEGYKIDFKGNNLDFVPKGQHWDKSGFAGGVTPEEWKITEARNPWFDWENFDINKKREIIPETGKLGNPDVARFAREYVKKTGRTDVKIDGIPGQQMSSLGVGWDKQDRAGVEPDIEPYKPNVFDAYKPIGGGYGGFPMMDALPFVPTPWMRNLPVFATPQYDRISPVKVSPEMAIAEASRNGRLATQATELGAGRAANLSNIQRVTSEISSEAVRAAEAQNAQLALQVNQFNAGQQGREEEGRINALNLYEPNATNRQMLNYEDWGSYYQQGYENRQNAVKDWRQRNTYQSMTPNVSYTPWGSVVHNPQNDIFPQTQPWWAQINRNPQKNQEGTYMTPEQFLYLQQQFNQNNQ